MNHFTQLNLQGHASGKFTPSSGSHSGSGGKTPTPNKPPKKQPGPAKTIAIAGTFAAAALVAVITLGTNGCSKSDKPAIAAPSTHTASMPQPMPAPTAAAPMAAAKPLKKSSRQHTLASYKNSDYGISFLYPKGYTLTKGDKADLDWAGLGPVEMNFVQPGGSTLASVQLPKTLYSGTDFASGFFSIAVNPKLAAKDCGQFAFADEKPTDANISDNDMDLAKPAKMESGAAEFTEVESSGGAPSKHADAKYYHVFQNGACYEFTLGLETSDGSAGKAVNHNAVFGRLNQMLATVKISEAGMPAKTVPAVAAKPDTTPAETKPEVASPSSMIVEPAPAATGAAVEGGKN